MKQVTTYKKMASRSPSPPSPGLPPIVPAGDWRVGHAHGYPYGNQLMPPPHMHPPGFYGPPPWPPPHPMPLMGPLPPASQQQPHGHRPPSAPLPPPPPSREVVRSEEITITHTPDAPPATSTSYFDDPYNSKAPNYNSTHKHVALQYHICSICRRPRSTRYHRQHPLIPGQQIIPEPCRKCRSAISSSSSEDDGKVIVNQPGKRAVRESESVRIVAMEDKDLRNHRRPRRRSGSRTRIVVRECRSNSPASPRGRHGRVDEHEVITIEETEEHTHRPHKRPESGTRIHIKNTEGVHDVRQQSSPTRPKDEDSTIIRRMRELRTHSVSPEPAFVHEQTYSRVVKNDPPPPPGPTRKPPVHRQTSDAERRLREHPQAFRHGVMIQVSGGDPPQNAKNSRRPAIEPPPHPEPKTKHKKDPSPPRASHGQRRHSIAYPSHEPEQQYSKTKLRSILRSQSRPRSGYWSPSPERDVYIDDSDEVGMAHGGPRVSFAPEPSSSRRKANPPHHEREEDRTRPAGKGARKHRPHVDGPTSSSESVPRAGPHHFKDYGCWQEPPQTSFQPRQDDGVHALDRNAARGRIVRKPSFSHDHDDTPAKHRARHVNPPDHITYYRSATPPKEAPPSGTTTYTDYAGTHPLPKPLEDTVPWSQRSIADSSNMSGGSYRMVDVRDLDVIDERGRIVRVREIEETHHPRKEGYHGGHNGGRGRDDSVGHRAVQHAGWRDV